MGLFSKTEGIGEKYKCAICGKTLYELTKPGDIKNHMKLMKKGYQWDSMYKCTSCGNCVCQFCMTTHFNTGCRCGAQIEVYPVARK